MISRIIAFLLVSGVAYFFHKIGKYTPENKDYSQYPTTEATVCHKDDNSHWIVRFIDPNGEEVLGRDDKITLGEPDPPDERVSKGTTEMVYYWPWDTPNHRYVVNGINLKYNIHFCNPIYDQRRAERAAKTEKQYNEIAVWIVIIGTLICIFA